MYQKFEEQQRTGFGKMIANMDKLASRSRQQGAAGLETGRVEREISKLSDHVRNLETSLHQYRAEQAEASENRSKQRQQLIRKFNTQVRSVLRIRCFWPRSLHNGSTEAAHQERNFRFCRHLRQLPGSRPSFGPTGATRGWDWEILVAI